MALAVAVMVVVSVGCAITDYGGWAGHKTVGEAKLWGKDIAWITGDELEGTYAYTVKYNNTPGVGSNKVTIFSYHNPVVGAFTRDGIVDMDGDDVQGSAGSTTGVPATPAGKFNNRFVSVDKDSTSCGFFGNITQDKTSSGPGIALCIGGANEEIDKDFELNEAFASIDSLLSQIWNGSLSGDFTLDLTRVRLNGVWHDLAGLPIGASVAASRPARFTISNGPGLQDLIGVILNHTESGAPVSLSLSFAGGMRVDAPAGMTVAFDHDVLLGL